MARQQLAAYLNDHLSGSVVALELLEHLEQVHAGTPLAAVVAQVRAEIHDDRAVLEHLIARLDINRSAPRQAVAWLGEKLAQLKLAFDDRGAGAMHLFESLEAVSLGIEGKGGLWRTLVILAPTIPALQGIDYPELIRRAESQRVRIEAERLRVALAALRPGEESEGEAPAR